MSEWQPIDDMYEASMSSGLEKASGAMIVEYGHPVQWKYRDGSWSTGRLMTGGGTPIHQTKGIACCVYGELDRVMVQHSNGGPIEFVPWFDLHHYFGDVWFQHTANTYQHVSEPRWNPKGE